MTKEELMACEKEAIVDVLLENRPYLFGLGVSEHLLKEIRRKERSLKLNRLYRRREEAYEDLKRAWEIKGTRGRQRALQLELDIEKIDAQVAKVRAIEEREWKKERSEWDERFPALAMELSEEAREVTDAPQEAQ